MNWIFLFCLCTTVSLSEQSSKRKSEPANETKPKVRALVDRKSYLVPLKTKFILKCTSSRFSGNERNEFGQDDQFDDDQPELIVLNNLEQTKKLVDYLSENSRRAGRIDLIGWNKTGLDRVKGERNGRTERAMEGAKENSGDSKRENKKFDKMYESMFLSGKGFFRPNERVDLFGDGQTCLLFTSFGKKDEAIYSCLYKPKLNVDWTGLLNFGGWWSRLGELIDSGNSADLGDAVNGFADQLSRKKLNDLNLNNNVPLIEKLLYVTCLLTWPFNRECHLVKQFKLTVESETSKSSPDYWDGLDSHERFRLKKLLKELVKYCHPISTALSALNKKRQQKAGKEAASSGFISDFLRLLFDELFVNVFLELINSTLTGLFSGLFSGLFGGLISGLFSGLFSSTASELFNELIGELFVDLFKESNLFYLICILLFIFICFSVLNDPGSDQKLSNGPTDEKVESKSGGIDLHIDAQIDAQLRDEESSEKDVEHGLSIKPPNAATSRKRNLKFNIDASVTNKCRKRFKKDSSDSGDFRFQSDPTATSTPFTVSSIPKIEGDERKKLNKIPRLDDLVSGPRKANEPADDFRRRWRSKSSEDLQVNRLRDTCRLKVSPQRNAKNDELDNSANSEKVEQDQNLEFKGEIVISKPGELSYLGKFRFNLPEELEEKPLQLILETTNSLNQQMTGGHLNDDALRPSFSRDLDHERTDAN